MKITKENGAALIVSLMILIVTALIGLSSMSSTTLETKMVLNSQTSAEAFQAAETAIENSITIENILTAAVNTASGVTNTYAIGAGSTSTGTVTYLGTQLAPGFSLKAGGGGFAAHQFIVVGSGTADNGNTRKQHTLGAAQIGPSL